jgi:hypothetical protein
MTEEASEAAISAVYADRTHVTRTQQVSLHVEAAVVDRRGFLGGAMLIGGAPGGREHETAGPAPAATGEDNSAELRSIADQLVQLRAVSQRLETDVAPVREQIHVFLKSTGKYPDYMDVGLGIWNTVYDWHVRWQQTLTIGRLADGLYTMAFMMTTLVLRPNNQTNYIGPGYDK